jgi:hypothetical protein
MAEDEQIISTKTYLAARLGVASKAHNIYIKKLIAVGAVEHITGS